MHRLAVIALVAIVPLAAAPAVFAETITLTGASQLSSSATWNLFITGCNCVQTDAQTASPASLPTAGVLTANAGGIAETTEYDLSETSFALSFSTGQASQLTMSSQNSGFIAFTLGIDMTFLLSGGGTLIEVTGDTSNFSASF